MLGNVVFVVLVLIEIGFIILCITKKSNLKKEKSIVRISLFVIFMLLVLSPIIDWSFKWFMLGLFLGIQALFGILALIRKRENNTFKKSKIILSGLSRVLFIGILILPAIILPQYDDIKHTGEYPVGTISYTLTDESRKEAFTKEDDNRKVSIQFWYPEQTGQKAFEVEDKFPLVIFSHGAFGYRMSNNSTFQELASQGYIVCSIDHTYHAFMTKQDNGETIIANMDFMNNAMKAQNGELSAVQTYELGKEWMKLRTGDMAFILESIRKMKNLNKADLVFQNMDLDHIGVLGHSLGGATAAQIGREDKDVDAVIVIDGTMLGEITGFQDGKELITDTPYPVPIMNMYNESHYQEALKNKENYANMVATKNALDSYEVIIQGAGHINFTDLPIVSPFLSKLMGTGDVDARYCIEKSNGVILEFFNHYLKASNTKIEKKRIY